MNEYNDQVLTLNEASAFLKVAKSTLTTWALQGKIKSYKLGKCRRFMLSDLLGFLQQKHCRAKQKEVVRLR